MVGCAAGGLLFGVLPGAIHGAKAVMTPFPKNATRMTDSQRSFSK